MEHLIDRDDPGFEDHSISTEIERLTFAIEQAAAKWFLAILSGRQLPGEVRGSPHGMIRAAEVIQHNFPFRKEPYALRIFHTPTGAEQTAVQSQRRCTQLQLPFSDTMNHARYDDSAHNLQRWFGVGSFMTLTPLQGKHHQSVGRSEACTLRSAAACALGGILNTISADRSPLLSTAPQTHDPALAIILACTPLFVPVYCPQDGFWSGISCVGSSHVFLETESAICGTEITLSLRPVLTTMSKHLQTADPRAAFLCMHLDHIIGQHGAFDDDLLAKFPKIVDPMRTTIAVSRHVVYELEAPWMNGFTPHAYRSACALPEAWDMHAPWRPWAELPDFVSGVRLEVTWRCLPLQEFVMQSKFGAIPADDWVVRSFSCEHRPVTPIAGFEAGSEQQSSPCTPLEVKRPDLHCLGASGPEMQKSNRSRPTHASFSTQLKAFIPVVVVLVNEPKWKNVSSSSWWQVRGARRPCVPPKEALIALSRDALCGESTVMNGISTALSATAFVHHMLSSLETFSANSSTADISNSSPGGKDKPFSRGTDGLPPWPGAHVLTTPLGLLSLHMLKLDCPRAVAYLWQVFVRTVALDFCESIASFGDVFSGPPHRKVVFDLGLFDPIQITPQAFWMQSVKDGIDELVMAHRFRNWVEGESQWEAEQLGVPLLTTNSDRLTTIAEEQQPGPCIESLEVGINACIQSLLEHILRQLGAPCVSDRAILAAQSMSDQRAESMATDSGPWAPAAGCEAQEPDHDGMPEFHQPSLEHADALTRPQFSEAGVGCQVRESTYLMGSSKLAATGLTHGHFVHPEAKRRIVAALTRMCHAEAALGDEELITANIHNGTDSLPRSNSQLTIRRIWTAQQVQHISQCIESQVHHVEGRLQCSIKCLQESSPALVIIGAFLSSCQAALVSFMSCQAARIPCVEKVLMDTWIASAALSEQIWNHIGGPALLAACRAQSAKGVEQLPILSPKLTQPQNAKLIELLTAIVRDIEYAERLVAVAENLTRRLHGCPNTVADLVCSVIRPSSPNLPDAEHENVASSRSAAGTASVHNAHERSCISQLMTHNWRRLAHQAKSPTPTRMWSDPLYDPSIGAYARPTPWEMKSARAALDERVRDQWCNSVLEELTVVCEQQASKQQHCGTHDHLDCSNLTHRAYIQKKGDAVRTATAVVCGNAWHGT
eukprot:jgi/Ulvmu1/4031/UM019_0008.1